MHPFLDFVVALCYTNQTCAAIESLRLEVLTVSLVMHFVSAIAYVQGQCERLVFSMMTGEKETSGKLKSPALLAMQK